VLETAHSFAAIWDRHKLTFIFYFTSHTSIAYRKQIPPQQTVGTIGSVWQENTPSKETTGPAKRYENEQSEMRNGARGLSLSP